MIVDLLETLVHFFYALRVVGAPGDSQGVGIFLGVVFLFGKVAPLLLVSFIWFYAREIPEFVWRTYDFTCTYACTGPRCGSGSASTRPCGPTARGRCSKSSAWASRCFFWLGAGYFVFPSCMCIAGIVRCYTWIANPSGYYKGADAVFALNMNRPDDVTAELREIYNSYYYVAGREAALLLEPAPQPLSRRATAPAVLPSQPQRAPSKPVEPSPNEAIPEYKYPIEQEPRFDPATLQKELAQARQRRREPDPVRPSSSSSSLPSLSNLFSLVRGGVRASASAAHVGFDFGPQARSLGVDNFLYGLAHRALVQPLRLGRARHQGVFAQVGLQHQRQALGRRLADALAPQEPDHGGAAALGRAGAQSRCRG